MFFVHKLRLIKVMFVMFITKWRENSLRQTLQVRVTSDTQKIQSSD